MQQITIQEIAGRLHEADVQRHITRQRIGLAPCTGFPVLCACEIAVRKFAGLAAICSQQTPGMSRLHIIEKGIETAKFGFTRFPMPADESRTAKYGSQDFSDEAFQVFRMANTQGRLEKVLVIFTFHDSNLMKFQPRPIIRRSREGFSLIENTTADCHRCRPIMGAVVPPTSRLKTLCEDSACTGLNPDPKKQA